MSDDIVDGPTEQNSKYVWSDEQLEAFKQQMQDLEQRKKEEDVKRVVEGLTRIAQAAKEKAQEAVENKDKSITEWQQEAHALAKEKGWHDGNKRTTVETYTMIAGEAFEAINEYREGKPSKYYEGDKPCGEAIEMADIVLRVMDYCEFRGWSLEELLKEKHRYNSSRSYRHGNKKV